MTVRLAPRSGTRPALGDQRGQAGETLIELMVTSVLMGVAIVALVTGLLNTVIASDSHRRMTRSGNEAVRLSEAVIAAPYQRCTATPDPATQYATVFASVGGTIAAPTGYTYSIVSVQFLQDKTASTPVFGTTCPASDQGAQRVEVAVTSTGRSTARESVIVVKRDPT